jgi:ABC-type phosphate transport system substrate-binding protein
MLLNFATLSAGTKIGLGCLVAVLVVGSGAYLYQDQKQPGIKVSVEEQQPSLGQIVQAPRAVPKKPSIVVLVNKGNPVKSLSLRELARIYRGEMTEWPNGEGITAINRPIDSEIRRKFYDVVLDAGPAQKFFKTGSPIPFETIRVDSEGSVAKFVVRDRGAIGYCFAPCADSSVKAIPLEEFPLLDGKNVRNLSDRKGAIILP